jgi:hypothetical protein
VNRNISATPALDQCLDLSTFNARLWPITQFGGTHAGSGAPARMSLQGLHPGSRRFRQQAAQACPAIPPSHAGQAINRQHADHAWIRERQLPAQIGRAAQTADDKATEAMLLFQRVHVGAHGFQQGTITARQGIADSGRIEAEAGDCPPAQVAGQGAHAAGTDRCDG